MSIFGNIVSKLFGHSSAQAAPAPAPVAPTAENPAAPAATHGTAPAAPATTHGTTTAGPAATGTAPAAPAGAAHAEAAEASRAPLKDVDVAAILDGLVVKAGQRLDWRHSIVDLLKALDMDSSLSARKELAHELHYAGSTEDSAAMNIWLSKQVLIKLAENGGKLPADLVH